MHYQLVAKVSDFTTEELQHKMQGFLVVNDDETVNQYGCWKIASYSDFNEFVEDECLEEEEEYQTMIAANMPQTELNKQKEAVDKAYDIYIYWLTLSVDALKEAYGVEYAI